MIRKLYLRAFEYEDLDFINFLRNDDELFEFTCGNKFFISSERDKKWIEDKIFNNSNQIYLMLSTLDTNIPIGYVAATDIDYLNRKAQYGGIIIAKEFSGKGYGTEASQLILTHIFEELGMNMIYGYWREDHKVSLKMAEKIGFKKIGLVRDFVYKKNRFHNAYLCSLLKEDYDSMKKSKEFL